MKDHYDMKRLNPFCFNRTSANFLPRAWVWLLFLALFCLSGVAHAQSAAFTYHGRLNDNGLPVNGTYEMQFTLYAVDVGGLVVAGPIPISPVDVVKGLFTVRVDFVANVFTGPARWLEVAVRPAGAPNFTLLTPRQEVTSSPYAIRAQTAGTATSIADGTVTAAQLNTGGVAPAAGQFLSYNNGNFLWTDPAAPVGEIWSRNGTTAYYSSGGVGLGTNNVTPGVRLEINGVARFTPAGSGGSFAIGGPNGETGASVIGVNRFDLRFNGSSVKLVAGPGVGPPPAEYGITVTTNGSVGVGTTTPTAGYRLEVAGATVLRPGNGTAEFGSPNGELGMTIKPTAGNRADLRFDGVTLKLLATTGVAPPSSVNGITINAASGNVGIGGSPFPVAKLEVVGQDALRLIGFEPFLTLLDSNFGYTRSFIQSARGEMILGPESYLNGSDGNAYVKLFNSGNLSVKSLTIRGGADLAEPFDLSGDEIAKGSVVIIDDENPGKLKLSSQAYDTRVAGIVSGANGVNPGISLHQDGVLEGGQNVALSGRVFVRADATQGAIKPGDLLTTSGAPGHAMKVTDQAKAQGAILGKAMSTLKEGKGMVLVLVTLQ